MLIQFNGELSSWWTRIAVGALTLIFIGVQSYFSYRREGRSLDISATSKAEDAMQISADTVSMDSA
jgi:simple sugar transport system permease protein